MIPSRSKSPMNKLDMINNKNNNTFLKIYSNKMITMPSNYGNNNNNNNNSNHCINNNNNSNYMSNNKDKIWKN